jgi:signal transduction histidine kinase
MALSNLRELRQYANPKIFASLAAITVVALGATGAVIYCLHTVLRVRQESIQITKVQGQLNNFNVELLNAETGQRGYLLTGNADYLKPYQQALKEIPAEGEQLEALSAGYSYAGQVKEVRGVAKDKLDELSSAVAAYGDQGPEAALAAVQTGRGQRDMDRLRVLLGDIGKQQATELAAKRSIATKYGVWANWIAGTMLVVIGMLAGLVYYLFLQAIKSERALDKAKDEFVSLASHQLRTPATAVKSILSMLRSDDFGSLNERQRGVVDQAIESNEREIRIVEELLDVARADAGRLVLKPSALDLGELVDAVAAGQRSSIEAKRQHLTVRGPKHPATIMADGQKLHMAISNLLDNASKYTSEGGHIKMTVRHYPGMVGVEVADNGVGIDQEELVNIFDRFQRAHDILMSGADGTGLGLYIARHLAELHDGTIKVESVKGRGSTFTLMLPHNDKRD